MSLLDALRRHTTIVADTGDIAAIARLAPRDATTNPSLILKAVQQPSCADLIDAALRAAAREAAPAAGRADPAGAVDHLLVAFGGEILRHIDGRVSTEVEARLSFDTRATVERARRLVHLYECAGVDPARVLIKIAATWEGIRAAEVLEREGIRCNITLLFALVQAEAAALAQATLISPFVGRIYDWHRKAAGPAWDEAANAGASDPGVRSVRAIFARLKAAGSATEIMGASFRNVGQVLALAGCDLLTISPELLDALAGDGGELAATLVRPPAGAPLAAVTEADFRARLNADAMASDKLAEGIRIFVADQVRLEAILAARSATAGS